MVSGSLWFNSKCASSSVTGEQGGSVDARVAPELGRDDAACVERRLERAAARVLNDRSEQEVAGSHDVAADDDDFDVEQVDRAGERDAEEHSGPVHDELRHVVAVDGGPHDVVDTELAVAGNGDARQRA